MKNRHRIFIAINLPGDVKKGLVFHTEKWSDLPAKWTKKDNLHITLEFLGNVSDEELLDVLKDTQELAEKHTSFNIKLDKICYGPIRFGSGQATPRMVWATGPKIEELNLIPHITLARIKKWDWNRIELDERPQIDEDINLEFEVNSIEAMESVLKKGGPEYIILESFELKS
ncbi:hypothetical protein KKC65_03525 [Patescibacteria group bacterium]|nr:hypothetical protein [Patescibacteria group bacterium]